MIGRPVAVGRQIMKDIVVLGPGCPNCERLAQNAEAAAKALGLEYQLYKITDVRTMAGFGVKATPALMVDNVVKISGRVPTVEELEGMLR